MAEEKKRGSSGERKITIETVENPYKKKSSATSGGRNTSGTVRRSGYDTTAFDAEFERTINAKKKKTSVSGKTTKVKVPSGRATSAKSGASAVRSKKKKGPSTVLTVLLAIVAVVILGYFGVRLSTPIVFSQFYKNAQRAVDIPGMKEGFIPQGLAYSEDADVYLICGYMQNGEASRIYVVTPEGKSKEIRLKSIDGKVYTGHAGGISCNGDNVYVSNSGKVFHLSLTALLEATDCQSVRFDGSFDVPCRASFTFCDDKMLYVGEFHHTGYDTRDANVIELENGEKNYAMVFGYTLDQSASMGVHSTSYPQVAYSVRDKVQGFAMTEDGRIVLSCSFGLADSWLYFYNQPKPIKHIYNDKEILLYVLDDSCIENSIKAPFMSEDIDIANGYIIINFESYALKYGGGMLPFSVKNIIKYKY